jgi:hypothetical protein
LYGGQWQHLQALGTSSFQDDAELAFAAIEFFAHEEGTRFVR